VYENCGARIFLLGNECNPKLFGKVNHMSENKRTRREFLKLGGIAAVSMAALKTLPEMDPPFLNEKQDYHEPDKIKLGAVMVDKASPHITDTEFLVALAGVTKDSDDPGLMSAVKEAAQAATDFGWLASGDSVLIKPALNSGNPYPATTSPEGIKAMVELLMEKGAGRVVVSDMSGIEFVKLTPDRLKGSSRKLMHASGMAQAALEAGAELHFPEEVGWDAFFEDYPVDTTYWTKGIMMPNILKEVDHIVLMPRCGRHLLLGSSLGMKCAVGYWRTDSRLEYHKNAATIQEKTADANTVNCLRDKQRLVLTTATQILTTLGPNNGFVATPETGLVIASESIVAHDMVSLAWLLHNRAVMTEQEQAGSRDPYQRQVVVGILNRIVVNRLGGIREVAHAERLQRNDIDSIWDDRVLNRAYEVFGGIPRIELVDVVDAIPQEIIEVLLERVSKL
jgi:uncharacterized protein (DUF362 family)